MKKKHTQKAIFTPKYDSQRETNVLLEHMHKDIKTVAEGHTGLNQKLDRIGSELSSVKASVLEVDGRLKRVEIDVKQLKTDVT